MICKGAEGVKNFIVNGTPWETTEDDITIQPDKWIKEPQANGRVAYRKTSPSISFTLSVPPEVRIKDMVQTCDSTVVVEMWSGRTFTLTGATLVHEGAPFDAHTGKLTGSFVGRDCLEFIGQGALVASSAAA